MAENAAGDLGLGWRGYAVAWAAALVWTGCLVPAFGRVPLAQLILASGG